MWPAPIANSRIGRYTPAMPAEASVPGQTIQTILIIEDHDEMRQTVRSILEFEGFRVIEASDAGEGIDAAIAGAPDVILCDIGLKQSNGYQVLSAIRNNAATADTPFIYLTAMGSDLRRGMESGADDFITKPFTAESLINSIRTRLLRRRQIQTASSTTNAMPREDDLREVLKGVVDSPDNAMSSLVLLTVDMVASLSEDRSSRGKALQQFRAWLDRLLRLSHAGRLLAVADGHFLALLSRDASGQDQRLAARVVLRARRWLALRSRFQTLRVQAGIVRHAGELPDVDSALRGLEQALQTGMVRGEASAVWARELAPPAYDMHRLQTDIQKAALRGELDFDYQPICSPDGRVLGAECLLRWRHPFLGAISPGIFIPLAERSGAIHEIGRWGLRRAIRTLQHLRLAAFEGYLSINMSPLQLTDTAFLDDALAALNDPNFDPRRLEIELTESAIVSGGGLQGLEGLRACGYRLSMDDFGTGYSSLGALRTMPVDRVKIDRSFIVQIHNNPQNAAFLSSVLELTRILGLPVTVEGVEEKEQLNILKDMGITSIQGYLFSKPTSLENLSAMILSREGLAGALQ